MQHEIIPLISGATAGPLGLTHLPRFWLKMRLHACERLPAEYRHGTGGTDEFLLTTFGIDADALAAYVAGESPDYIAFEAWWRANATGLTPEAITGVNERIVPFELMEPRKSEWLARFGLDGSGYTASMGLNQLDDWDLLHAQLAAQRGAVTPVVPAISSAVAGPLGAYHVPRLWVKLLLFAYGRLPEGYRHGSGAFDSLVPELLGLDNDALIAFVSDDKPGYLAFEAWVRARATSLTPDSVAALNARLAASTMPDAMAAERRGRFGISDPAVNLGIPLNDLDDWDQLHVQLRENRV